MEENLEEEIFPLSVIYLDRFLSVSSLPIRRTQLQLIGCVCLFIASKFKSSLPLKAENLVWFTANSITHDELIVSRRRRHHHCYLSYHCRPSDRHYHLSTVPIIVIVDDVVVEVAVDLGSFITIIIVINVVVISVVF